jgi:hypothetical protein
LRYREHQSKHILLWLQGSAEEGFRSRGITGEWRAEISRNGPGNQVRRLRHASSAVCVSICRESCQLDFELVLSCGKRPTSEIPDRLSEGPPANWLDRTFGRINSGLRSAQGPLSLASFTRWGPLTGSSPAVPFGFLADILFVPSHGLELLSFTHSNRAFASNCF